MNPVKARELLLKLTGLPTAAGREDAVIRFVRAWARRRRRIQLEEDDAGNLVLTAAEEPAGAEPVYLVAHTDHPAAEVTAVDPATPRRVTAAFRGWVEPESMKGAAVRLHPAGDPAGAGVRGRVLKVAVEEPGGGRGGPGERPDPTLTAAFGRSPGARPGDVLTWDLGKPVVRGSRLHAPACDDLAGVAAALAALDAVARRRQPPPGQPEAAPLRVLLTRAEEVGFVGAIAACRLGTLPPAARVVVLECSKASAEAPIGSGPVVRVGDRASTFDPGLTGSLAAAAAALEREDAADAAAGRASGGFGWQRKLMTGGTCEATAYAAFGLTASCVCLPLGNYHNMSDAEPGKLEREVISLRDFSGMVRLLERLPDALGASEDAGAGGLRGRLEALHARREHLLRPVAR